MKKILSLVLAAAMLSTTAFAAGAGIGSGASQDIDTTTPGSTIWVKGNSFMSAGKLALPTDWHFSSEYLTISSKSFAKGANLVKEVKINDNDMRLDIVLNDNYDLKMPNGDNLVIKKLAVKGRDTFDATKDNDEKTTVSIKKGTEYVYEGSKNLKVGFSGTKINLDGSPLADGTNLPVAYKMGDLVEFDVGADKTIVYETVSLDGAADIYLEGRVYDGDKVYVDVNYDANKEVLKAADENADIRFYNITTNGFPTANTIQLSVDEDQFVYKLVDGKLVASGLKWSADDYAWTGKIRSSVSYVVSDIELKSVAAAEPGTDNPDTGANDVVGIAAALALVSLVAAGAVSMKK